MNGLYKAKPEIGWWNDSCWASCATCKITRANTSWSNVWIQLQNDYSKFLEHEEKIDPNLDTVCARVHDKYNNSKFPRDYNPEIACLTNVLTL
jgi:hypothetical protein